MLEVVLNVILTLKGPILTRSTAIGEFGVDAPLARNSREKYYLPFSLVRGRLRQSWIELREATGGAIIPAVEDWFGPEPGETRTREPQRGKLRFSDFVHCGESNRSGRRYRIRIDPARGAAMQTALQVIESPFASGESVTFTGCIDYWVEESEADAVANAIRAGLRWTTNFGGERTSGFGRVENVVVRQDTTSPAIHPSSQTATATPDALFLAITPQAPFCVSQRRVNPNLFESDIFLAGGVLRGALVTSLQDMCGLSRQARIDGNLPHPWQELGAAFDQLRFSHAFPAAEGKLQRPTVAPLSLVKIEHKDKKDDIYDAVLNEGPFLIKTKDKSFRAPTFDIDWKKSEDVSEGFGWTKPERELRVRTAMDRNTRRAEDEKLFAYDMVVPKGCIWYAKISLKEIKGDAQRAQVVTQLRTIFEKGLRNIGKTKVSAKIDEVEFSAFYDSDSNPTENVWVITLQTPTLLCDPAPLSETSTGDDLFQQYAGAWSALSKNTLELRRFFARQTLAGGYLVHRFQPGKAYNPFLLTEPGSVFVLEATGDTGSAQSHIETWLSEGLPLPKWAVKRYGDHWQTCPFRPQDGFGEIAVNLPCHTERKPTSEVICDL